MPIYRAMLLPLLTMFTVLLTPSSALSSDCASLDQGACMAAASCAFTGTFCGATNDACEIAWDELSDVKADCTSMSGCTYIEPEPCYCPPDVDCTCGGGAPPRCVTAE